MKKRLVCLALVTSNLGAACKDEDAGATPTDALESDVDADPTDARDIDAAPAIYAGSISLIEANVLNPGTAGTFFGQGPQLGISFASSADVPPPVLEEMSESALGCKAWQFTPPQAAAAAAGLDEGVVRVTVTGTSATPIPPCAHTTGVGYVCPHADTTSTGGVIAVGATTGTATLTDADTTFTAANTSGRYVRIAGATNVANNGVFPIVGFNAQTPNTLVYANARRVAETIPSTGSHVNLYGVGPIPNAADPGFLRNDSIVSVTLTAGGGNHLPTFTSATPSNQSFGDDFTLALSELNELNAIPRNGSAFTITCDATSCPAGSAAGTVLQIVTTDTPTTGLSPFAMPPPTSRQVKIRCGVLGRSAITVPAEYSALIMGAGATRMQATFIRGALLSGGPPEVSVVAGHAIVGFTN